MLRSLLHYFTSALSAMRLIQSHKVRAEELSQTKGPLNKCCVFWKGQKPRAGAMQEQCKQRWKLWVSLNTHLQKMSRTTIPSSATKPCKQWLTTLVISTTKSCRSCARQLLSSLIQFQFQVLHNLIIILKYLGDSSNSTDFDKPFFRNKVSQSYILTYEETPGWKLSI